MAVHGPARRRHSRNLGPLLPRLGPAHQCGGPGRYLPWSPASSANNLVLRADGTVVNWSGNTQPPPCRSVLTNGNIVAVAAGGLHQLALRDNSTVIAWGSNTYGQTNVPAEATNVVAIAAGANHSLALRADGKVVGWGLNTSGQANALSAAANVVAIAAGGNQTMVLVADGSVIGLL